MGASLSKDKAKSREEHEAARRAHDLAMEKVKIESELNKINKDFDSHKEELIKSMSAQSEEHKRALQKRLAKRRMRKRAQGVNPSQRADSLVKDLSQAIRHHNSRQAVGIPLQQQMDGLIDDLVHICAASGM